MRKKLGNKDADPVEVTCPHCGKPLDSATLSVFMPTVEPMDPDALEDFIAECAASETKKEDT